MSIEVRVPEEISDYKESIVAGLSVRQLICGGAAFLCGIPTFMLLKDFNMDIATYATMIVVVPAFCVGFIKKDGYNFEHYLKIRLKAMFCRHKRSYETNPDANELPAEVEKYREAVQEYYRELEEAEENDKKIKGTKNAPPVASDFLKRGEKLHFKKERKRNKSENRLETDFIEVTKKSSKRARKAAFKSLKAKARSCGTKK